MKKSFVKFTSAAAAALVLAGAAAPVFADDLVLGYEKLAEAQEVVDWEKGESINYNSETGLYEIQQDVAPAEDPVYEGYNPAEEGEHAFLDDEEVKELRENEDKNVPANERVNAPGAQDAAFEPVPRIFNSLKEAKDAFPHAFVMADGDKFIVYTDGQDLVKYEFDSVEDAKNAFPEKDVYAENGKFYIWSDHLPLVKYEFDNLRDARNAFPGKEPLAENGKFYVWSNELPLRAFVFDSLEEALKAFPGSNPMAENGKFYVYSKYAPLYDAEYVEYGEEGNADAERTKVEGRNESDSKEEKEASSEAAEKEEAEKEASSEAAADKKEEAQLPETGEASGFAAIAAAAVSLFAGLGFIAKKED